MHSVAMSYFNRSEQFTAEESNYFTKVKSSIYNIASDAKASIAQGKTDQWRGFEIGDKVPMHLWIGIDEIKTLAKCFSRETLVLSTERISPETNDRAYRATLCALWVVLNITQART